MSTEYGADQIQILEGLEAVRKDLVCILMILPSGTAPSGV